MIKRDSWEHKLLFKVADLMGYSASYFEQEKRDGEVIISKIRFSYPNPNLYWRHRLTGRRWTCSDYPSKPRFTEILVGGNNENF